MARLRSSPLRANADDERRGLNRPENVRPIPPGDPDFARLYRRRNDAELINRGLDDTLWLRCAQRVGHARQQINILGYALLVNGLAVHKHADEQPSPPPRRNLARRPAASAPSPRNRQDSPRSSCPTRPIAYRFRFRPRLSAGAFEEGSERIPRLSERGLIA
jgi:hypothetical protein